MDSETKTKIISQCRELIEAFQSGKLGYMNMPEDFSMSETMLREHLSLYKIALQPNKHIATWQKIAKTISENWGTLGNLLQAADYDFLKLKDIVQKQHKSGFPYLSGPKIFNYWSFILQ